MFDNSPCPWIYFDGDANTFGIIIMLIVHLDGKIFCIMELFVSLD